MRGFPWRGETGPPLWTGTIPWSRTCWPASMRKLSARRKPPSSATESARTSMRVPGSSVRKPPSQAGTSTSRGETGAFLRYLLTSLDMESSCNKLFRTELLKKTASSSTPPPSCLKTSSLSWTTFPPAPRTSSCSKKPSTITARRKRKTERPSAAASISSGT